VPTCAGGAPAGTVPEPLRGGSATGLSHPEVAQAGWKPGPTGTARLRAAPQCVRVGSHDDRRIALIGRTIGPYNILGLLGQGGMGAVYRARDTVLGRDVAIKALLSELGDDARQRQRFLSEARAAAALDHPFICKIFGIEDAGDATLIVMELVEGETLADRIQRGALPLDEVVRIADEAAEALATAHEMGFVHRDIKPSNLMLTRQGHVKILDFGVAKRFRGAAADGAPERTVTDGLTTPGQVVGTVSYMAPEQLRGEPADPRSDIFSFGVVLYQMLTGRHPFRRPSPIETASAILSESPTAVRDLRHDAPAALSELLARALAKHAAERFQSFDDLRRALARGPRSGSTEMATLAAFPKVEPAASRGDRDDPFIAVLPFASLSADKENEYFCDGLAEEIIGALTKTGGLSVVARSSSFAFKGRREDVREIGRLLSVGVVLDGSVRRAGDRLRVTAQLMNAETGLQIWSETYDGGMEDVFGIQDRISSDIARALQVKLVTAASRGASRVAPARVTSMACYNLYLKGLHHAAKATSEGYQSALEAFSGALREDPTFAKAHIGIADIYVWLGYFTVLPPALVFPKAREHAERALEIDDSEASGWNVLANVSYNYDWDWAAAERSFQRALALNPKLVATLYSYSVFQQNMGRHAEAVQTAKHAADLDPLSPVVQANVGWRHYWAGDLDTAIESWRTAVELHPNSPIALLGLVSAYRDQGRFEEITAEMERHLLGAGATAIGVLGHFYAISGRPDEAHRMLAELERRSATEYVGHYNAAFVHLGLGDRDRTLALLQDAVVAREGLLFNLVARPFDGLRADRRFRALVKAIGLPFLDTVSSISGLAPREGGNPS
jgi:serine/threonine-protein kinase